MALTQNTPRSQRAELAARGMDVSARGMDLLQTIAEITNSSNGAIKTASNVMYWLGRERINQEDLEHCLTRAKDLVHPNGDALLFYNDVLKGIEMMPQSVLRPFKSISSGSLGRFLVFDPGLAWITSTISGLYQFHDESFIAHAVTALIVHMNAQREGDQTKFLSSFWSNPVCLKMMPVVKKITSSVWLNIVNSGNASMPLPEELRTICPVGHHLDINDLVEALARLNHPCRAARVIISSQYLLGNLILWLIYHFNGLLRVIVSGKTTYESRLGYEEREVEVRVSLRCGSDGECSNARDNARQFEMVECIASDWRQFFKGNSLSSSSLGHKPRVRKALYDLDAWRSITPLNSHAALQSKIRQVALDMVRWICRLRIEPFAPAISGIVYKVDLKRTEASGRQMTLISDLLKRSPSILQAAWASELPRNWAPEDAVEIWSPQGFAQAASHSKQRPEPSDDTDSVKDTRASLIRGCFPGLDDLISRAQAQCQCVTCSNEKTITHLQSGCLKFHAYAAVLTLLGHSVADAFSADDVSGAEDTSFQVTNPDVYFVERILLDIAQNSRIVWQTWFQVAACVYLGRCYVNPGVKRRAKGMLTADGTMLMAIQYGGLAVVAPWTDLSLEISHIGSFGFVTVRGRLCVPTATKDHPGSITTHQVVDDDFAVIKDRKTEFTATDDQNVESPISIADIHLPVDDHDPELDVILFSSDHEEYHLLTRVRSGKYSRLVSTSATAILQSKLIHSQAPKACKHESGLTSNEAASVAADKALVYPFDKMLGQWPGVPLGRLHMSQFIDTYLKYNVALALAEGGIVAVNGTRCWTCAARRLLETQGRRIAMSSGLFLINTTSVLREEVEINPRSEPSKEPLRQVTAG
ncbi:hypothetical protein G7Y79_00004g013380 [Physcia stellaris]|nr:hypothetical protein G7Y79_00004g013380 [Physcia stellaris]